MQSLQTVETSLIIINNALLATITPAFGQLTSVGAALTLTSNAAITSVTNAIFGSLATVGGTLEITGNAALTSISGAFPVRVLGGLQV
jgi:hypothetical protein